MSDVVVAADRVLVGEDREVMHDGAVLLRDGRIAAVHQTRKILELAETGTVPLLFEGCTLLPGLIDSHVHLAFDGGPDPASTLARLTDEQLFLAMATRAGQALAAGITTVRDLGDRNGLAIKLRNQIASGGLAGPRILAAGPPLTIRPGHCDFLGGDVNGPAEIREAIARNARAGADLIKVMATGGHLTPHGPAMWESQFSAQEIRVIVKEAARFNLPVAAHAHGTRGITDAVANGVRTIEHCNWLAEGRFDVPEAVVQEIVARGISVSPAISANWKGFPERFGQAASDALLNRLGWLHQRGVHLAAGTDAGVPGSPFTAYLEALEAYRHIGFTNERIIEFSTAAAAATLGIAETTGKLTPRDGRGFARRARRSA